MEGHPPPNAGILPDWTPTVKQSEVLERLSSDLAEDGLNASFPPGSVNHDGEGNISVALHKMDERIAPVTVWIDPDGFTWDL